MKVGEVVGSSVELTWDAPANNGNSEIQGYRIEKRDRKTRHHNEWFLVHEKVSQKIIYDMKIIIESLNIKKFQEKTK